jgi:lipoyl(octanoyl) transferase
MQTYSQLEGVGTTARPLDVRELGIVRYQEAWELQRKLVNERTAGIIPDTLLMLQHPHTFTCGRKGGRGHILATQEELIARGVTVLDVDRGGDVTYHGPGQLVAYPILNLAQPPVNRDLHKYIRLLEETLIGTLAHFGIPARRVGGQSGAWYLESNPPAKLAAIGVKVDGRAISSHGIALNVTTDLSYFDLIVPCGIGDKGVTSIGALLGAVPPMSEVQDVFEREFRKVFEYPARSSFE